MPLVSFYGNWTAFRLRVSVASKVVDISRVPRSVRDHNKADVSRLEIDIFLGGHIFGINDVCG